MKKNWRLIVLFMCSISLWPQIIYAELQDPTLPPGFSESGPLVLNAIMISATHKLAVINGKIAHVGDVFAGDKIVTIEPNFVVLDGPEGKITLQLLTNPTKIESSKNAD